jgi:tRNA pseudouridine38-40 synthase
MPRFRITLEYDGTDFEGWQFQPGGRRTVQGCLAQVLERICDRPVRVTGSGRTDSGVHAEGQVASVRVETRLGAAELQRALNGNLPRDVAVVAVEVVPDDFDARRSATSKLYRYRIWNGGIRSPLRARYSTWVPQRLDLDAMRRAAAPLVGEHDFASFQAAGSDVSGGSRRRLLRVDVCGDSGGEVSIEVEGSGFLRHMVRNIAGTLIEVGQGRRAAEAISEVLAARDRSRAGPTAPPEGLALLRVDYPGRAPDQTGTPPRPDGHSV